MTACVTTIYDCCNLTETFTVQEAIDQIGFGKFQVKLSILTGFAWVSDELFYFLETDFFTCKYVRPKSFPLFELCMSKLCRCCHLTKEAEIWTYIYTYDSIFHFSVLFIVIPLALIVILDCGSTYHIWQHCVLKSYCPFHLSIFSYNIKLYTVIICILVQWYIFCLYLRYV